MAAKGLLLLVCVFLALVALLVFAKTRPANAEHMRPSAAITEVPKT